MKSLSSVGLGLSVVFCCLFLALIAELYYMFWWKKKKISIHSEIENGPINPRTELFYMFCCKGSSLSHMALNPQAMLISPSETQVNGSEAQIQRQPSKDFLVNLPLEEESLETELMSMENLCGPPRFLFTIVEETKEDLLESVDGKERSVSRSTSDLRQSIETPYLTPLASPSLFTPPRTPLESYSNNNKSRFSQVSELVSDAEFNKMRSSQSPKFKFIVEAEEKLGRKVMEGNDMSGFGGSAEHRGVVKASLKKFLEEEEEEEEVS